MNQAILRNNIASDQCRIIYGELTLFKINNFHASSFLNLPIAFGTVNKKNISISKAVLFTII